MPLLGTQFEFMNDPPRYECEEDPHGNYSRVHCFEDCLTLDAQQTCQCSPAAAQNPAYPDKLCTATQLYHCFFTKLFPEDSNLSKAIVDACKKECKAPCHAWNYNKQVSYSSIPSEAVSYIYFRYLKLTKEKLQSKKLLPREEWEKMKRKIILDIYYSELDYTIIKHVIAMPLSSLIAQIGGEFLKNLSKLHSCMMIV